MIKNRLEAFSDGRILWANLHLLFWLSLVPFVTGWMGENHFARVPVALYGVVLLMAGVAYFILARSLAGHHGPDSRLAVALYVLVAVLWFVPDRRMEKALAE